MKKFKVGLQLFTVHEKMAADMDATLKAVKEAGYDYVELAGFHGKSAEEIKALLDKHGLIAISSHNFIDDFDADGEKVAEGLKLIGVEYCGNGYYPLNRFFENWDANAEKFRKAGKLLKEYGIQFMYHNHDWEFEKVDGKYLVDKLLDATSRDELIPELDSCWARYAGVDVPEYIRKYSGFMKILHLKDFETRVFGVPTFGRKGRNGEEVEGRPYEETGFKLVPVGYGIQNWKPILEAAEEAGVECVIVEQDNSPDRDPLEAIKMSREYLKDTFGL